MRKIKYRNKCWLPYSIVEDAVKNNWYHSLVYLVLLKEVHENNTFYNFTVRSIAKKIKVSHTVLSKHIAVLHKKRLIRFQDGHMIITSVKKVASEEQTFLVPIPTEKKFLKSISNIRTAIRSAVIIRNLKKQLHVLEEKTEIIKISKAKESTKEEVKRYRKLLRKHGFGSERSLNKETVLSVYGFGNVLGKSKETGKRVKKALCSMGIILSTKRTELVDTRKYTRRQFFMMELPIGHFVSRSGYIYKSLPCMITSRV